MTTFSTSDLSGAECACGQARALHDVLLSFATIIAAITAHGLPTAQIDAASRTSSNIVLAHLADSFSGCVCAMHMHSV
jgi:hypothetical protein